MRKWTEAENKVMAHRIALEFALECQREEDAKIIAAIEEIIQNRIAMMKMQGWIHVWDEVEVVE